MGRQDVCRRFWESSPGTWSNHAPVGDAAHVIERTDRRKTEPPVEILSGELCRECHLARSGVIRGLEEEPHHQATRALSARLGNRGNPCYQRLTALEQREGQAARRDGPALAVA